jgi:uncharacterized protein (DUF1684 family)
MKRSVKNLNNGLLFYLLFLSQSVSGQSTETTYERSVHEYVRNYIATHEVVQGEDRKHLHFFPPDSNYRVTATFEKMEDKSGFQMLTSQKAYQPYFRYGTIRFMIYGVDCRLTVYQSKRLLQTEQYKNHLFIPFTDATSGTSTYDGGRYIDIEIQDIKENKVIIDFNKAYNPYCCYTTGYNCPIPPQENALQVSIQAGEMKYTKPVHK